MLSVCAIGARFSSDPRLASVGGGTEAPGSGYFMMAVKVFSSIYAPCTIFDLQASAVATIWLAGNSSPVLAWAGAGYAGEFFRVSSDESSSHLLSVRCLSARKAIDVGAHCERRLRWSLSPLEDQLRKRALHVLIIMDRSFSFPCGSILTSHESTA